jgi:hypothetical protein
MFNLAGSTRFVLSEQLFNHGHVFIVTTAAPECTGGKQLIFARHAVGQMQSPGMTLQIRCR